MIAEHIKYILIYLVLFSVSCGESKKYEEYTDVEFPMVEEIVSEEVQTEAIFYSMGLPVEMSRVFKKLDAVYDDRILNPVENVNNYSSSSKAAINLGVYGVDFSYAKMFDQNQKAYEYLSNLHKLSRQMGIPEDFFGEAADQVEKSFNKQDTLLEVVRDVYIKTDRYLKKSDQGVAAAFIMLGGWMESLYIATEIYENDTSNKAVLARIAKQKYSLNSLVSFLYNYQGDMVMAKYIMMLKLLKDSYDKVAMISTNNSMSIDTTSKSISNQQVTIHYSKETMKDIIKIIRSFRHELIL
jgi:hypothetical protein